MWTYLTDGVERGATLIMATAWELRRRLVVTIDRIPGLDEAAAGSKFRNVVLPVKVKTGN